MPAPAPPRDSSGDRRLILILEDSEERIREFTAAIGQLNPAVTVRIWNDAPTMLAECPALLSQAGLISLDHDLNPMPGKTEDPGTGLEVADLLSRFPPQCPVILHTSNHERRWSMHNSLRHSGWDVYIVPPLTPGWIASSWLPKAKALVPSLSHG